MNEGSGSAEYLGETPVEEGKNTILRLQKEIRANDEVKRFVNSGYLLSILTEIGIFTTAVAFATAGKPSEAAVCAAMGMAAYAAFEHPDVDMKGALQSLNAERKTWDEQLTAADKKEAEEGDK